MTPPSAPVTTPPAARRGGLCSPRTLAVLLLLSAIPTAFLFALERRAAAPAAYKYRSRGWLRECAKWDEANRRFLVSTFYQGGISAVEESSAEERPLFRDPDVGGNFSLGIAIDRARGRLLVVYADVVRNRYSAVGAYDLATWDRIFFTQLSGPEDEKAYADDVAVDPAGNAYVTDVSGGKIWKVGLDGALKPDIRSPVFRQKEHWVHNLLALNGIVHHPDGYLLVIHTSTGKLFKVRPAAKDREEYVVSVIPVSGGSLVMGDGLEILSPSKLVVAGSLGTATVESDDGWETARVTGWYYGAIHRIATAATVKDGKVYVNHMVGGGLQHRAHLISEAVFKPVPSAASPVKD